MIEKRIFVRRVFENVNIEGIDLLENVVIYHYNETMRSIDDTR